MPKNVIKLMQKLKFNYSLRNRNCFLFLVLFYVLILFSCDNGDKSIQYEKLLSQNQMLIKGILQEKLRNINNHMFQFYYDTLFVNKKRKLIDSLGKTIQGIDSLNKDGFEKYVDLLDSMNIEKKYSLEFSNDLIRNKNELFKITLESMIYLQYYSLGSVYRFGTILPLAKNPLVFEGDSITFILHAQENANINDLSLEILESPEIDELITYNKAIVKFGTANELSEGENSKKVSKEMRIPIYNHFLDKKENMFVEFEYTVVKKPK